MRSSSRGSGITPEKVICFLQGYGIAAVDAVPFDNGIASDNFCVSVEDGSQYVVRCEYRRSLPALVQDREYILAASARCVRVPEGPWIDGRINETPVSARPMIRGDAVIDIPKESIPRPAEFGRVLARIHSSPCPQDGRRYFYNFVLEISDERWDMLPREFPAIPAYADSARLYDIALRFLTGPRPTLGGPHGVIHGDVTPSNFLVTAEGLTVLDWEKACSGYQLSDLAQYILHFSPIWTDSISYAVADFIHAYHEERRIRLDQAELLWNWVETFAAAFFVTDTAFATADLLKPMPSAARQAYYTRYCSRVFDEFLINSKELKDAVLNVSSRLT